MKIAGKYAHIYSIGGYWSLDYKPGIGLVRHHHAGPGRHYRMAHEPDEQGVWEQPGRLEAHYFL